MRSWFRQARQSGSAELAASGHFVHVYVDRTSRRPGEIPPDLRTALSGLLAPDALAG